MLAIDWISLPRPALFLEVHGLGMEDRQLGVAKRMLAGVGEGLKDPQHCSSVLGSLLT